MINENIKTFDDVIALLSALPNQIVGKSCATSETGEKYIEFHHKVPCRPADKAVAERFLCFSFYTSLMSYFESQAGVIYWRTKPEYGIGTFENFISHHESGPDVDHLIGKRGISDKDWIWLGAYCRVLKSDSPISLEVAA